MPCRLSADCVEEVRELALGIVTMRAARGGSIVFKRAAAQGSGSALRVSGGFEIVPPNESDCGRSWPSVGPRCHGD
jgi:hypothetical protein